MKKNKEKLWLRCVNIGNNPSDAEIKEFLDYPIAFDDLEVDILGKKIQANIIPDKPSLNEFKEWHKKFMEIFHRYLKTKWYEEDPIANAYKRDIDWLNNYSLQFERKLHTSPKSHWENGVRKKWTWVYFVEFRLDEKLSLMSYIVAQFNEYVASGQELRQCAALDCRKYFLPVRKAQKWHDAKCRKRVWAQENLLKN